MSVDMYRSGQLAEAVDSLLMPVMCIEERVNAVYRCAKQTDSLGVLGERLKDDVRRLEQSLKLLREVAGSGKPALRLVAAE